MAFLFYLKFDNSQLHLPLEFECMELLEAIKNRRSIYPAIYTGDPVAPQVVEDMLESANWAPTHRLTEPWRFTVFAGDGIEKLATFQSELYKKISTQEGSFDEAKYEKLANKPLLCSHIIAIGMKRDPKRSVPEIEEVCSVACAVQNMLLVASEANVGCYWGTGGVTYYDEAKAFFELDAEDKLLGFLYLGMPKKWPVGKRLPMESKVRYVKS